jgi:hypothetical protein
MSLTNGLEVELPRHVNSRSNQHYGMRRVRERDARQLIDSHLSGNSYGRDLDDIDRPLTDNVTSQNFACLAVDDQPAETKSTPIDYRARR